MSNQDEVFLTSEGLKELKNELHELEEVKRPALVRRVAKARDFGDLSENSEYTAAREDLSFIDGQIAELTELLVKSKLIKKAKKNDGVVHLGSRVIVNVNKMDYEFVVVGEWEADPNKKKISHQSPLGRALIGKKTGDQIEVEAPVGKIKYLIKEVE